MQLCDLAVDDEHGITLRAHPETTLTEVLLQAKSPRELAEPIRSAAREWTAGATTADRCASLIWCSRKRDAAVDETPEEREQAIEDGACFSRVDDPAPRIRGVEGGEDLAGAAVRVVEEPALIAVTATAALAEVQHHEGGAGEVGLRLRAVAAQSNLIVR